MADIIYCHQCGTDNHLPHKFCYKCASALLLRDNDANTLRPCKQCGQGNPSFARFCVQCSTPLVASPSKQPNPQLPVVFRNTQAAGGNACPACGREAPTLIPEYVNDLKAENRSREIRGSDGLIYGTMGPRMRIETGLTEPRPPFGTKSMSTLFTGTFGCILTFLLPAIATVLLPMLVGVNVALKLLIAAPFGFFLASRLYKFLLRPYQSRLDAAQARWRRARICLRCDAVFIPGEPIYTAERFLNRLVWTLR